MSDGERGRWRRWRGRSRPRIGRCRAQVLLLASDGVAKRGDRRRGRGDADDGAGVAGRGSPRTGWPGWGRFERAGAASRRSREETSHEIVQLTTEHHAARCQTHWSCRTMAKQVGVSSATVQRIWSDLGLQPHRVDTFKVSNDPKFEDKLIDVVGLYLNPPEKAIVLCMDEKSQIQALDRTQASLPMVPGPRRDDDP